MRVLWVCFVVGLCQASTNRPPSGHDYLDTIDFDPRADEDGFRVYMSMDNSDHWNQIQKEVIITIDDGYEVEKVLKKIEIDEFWGSRWIDFTKFSCSRQTQSISVCVKDMNQREKHVKIPTKLLFGREDIIAAVETVSPVDKIQLLTRNSVLSHCFHGGSVIVKKNGRHLLEAELSYSYGGQYTFLMRDIPDNDCQDIQYDITINSRYGGNLGMAKISGVDNKITLVLEGKVITMNTLDGFLYCTSRSARITEISDSSSTNIQSNTRRQFSLVPFLKTCQESVFQLEYLERGRHSLEIMHVPRDITVDKPSDEMREVRIGNEDFQNCPNTKTELQCYEDNTGNFVSIQNFTTATFSVEPYLEKTCRIRVWIDQRYISYAEFITILDPLSTLQWVLIGVGIGFVVLVIIVFIGICLARRRSPSVKRRPGRGAGQEMVNLRVSNRINTEDGV